MHPAIREKLASLRERHDELNGLLALPETAADPDQLRRYAQEHAQLAPVIAILDDTETLERQLADLADLEADPEMAELAAAERPALEAQIAANEHQLARHMIPKDPLDGADIYLEIRAGTGGDEAALFAGDLFRMYGKYAEQKHWKIEILSENPGEHGGYKEIISQISGNNVYSTLKFESGAHRVQRVPETESGGRIHTSAATVAILPVGDDIQPIEINPADLKVDTYRASGAGGQHVNKTDSAIRITHLPSGIVVECQEERSQHKNRAKAMRLLAARLLDAERTKAQNEQAAERKSLVGSGDRSERIRTYNYPQSRVTDHRINLTLYSLADILEGGLDAIITPLQQEQEANALLDLQNSLPPFAQVFQFVQELQDEGRGGGARLEVAADAVRTADARELVAAVGGRFRSAADADDVRFDDAQQPVGVMVAGADDFVVAELDVLFVHGFILGRSGRRVVATGRARCRRWHAAVRCSA